MDVRQQSALAELTQSVLGSTNLSTIMRQALTLIADALAVAYSTIWELLPDRSALVLRFGVGWQKDAVEGMLVEAAATSPIGYPVLSATPAMVADWPSETRFTQPPLSRDGGVISSLFVVIPGKGRPFGSLGVDVTASRMFGDAEIAFLQAVANILALAIERAQTNQTIERQVEQRTRQIEQQLVAAAEERAVLHERQRLARDLHDSVTQALYGITLHAQAAWRLLTSSDVENAAGSLRALQDTAQEALDEMRLLIFELRPPILGQVGLVAALQARLTSVEGRGNLQTQLIVDGAVDLPSGVELALYRIAQEALNNALKYAHAQRITLRIQQAQAQIVLEVIDDGVGFEPATASQTGGLGLRGIAERVAQLDGTCSVRSTPGGGTQLRVEIPV